MLMQRSATNWSEGRVMAIRFIGIDPETGTGQSPTVWVDEERDEIVVQGWKPGPELEAQCAATISHSKLSRR